MYFQTCLVIISADFYEKHLRQHKKTLFSEASSKGLLKFQLSRSLSLGAQNRCIQMQAHMFEHVAPLYMHSLALLKSIHSLQPSYAPPSVLLHLGLCTQSRFQVTQMKKFSLFMQLKNQTVKSGANRVAHLSPCESPEHDRVASLQRVLASKGNAKNLEKQELYKE